MANYFRVTFQRICHPLRKSKNVTLKDKATLNNKEQKCLLVLNEVLAGRLTGRANHHPPGASYLVRDTGPYRRARQVEYRRNRLRLSAIPSHQDWASQSPTSKTTTTGRERSRPTPPASINVHNYTPTCPENRQSVGKYSQTGRLVTKSAGRFAYL